jgi:tRNA-specific 2-thiouridylase
MSGGVDSSAAALLLHEAGYKVVGVTMKLYDLPDSQLPANHQGCCTVDDVEDARRVCHRLGVPHHVFNLQREFKRYVTDYFCEEYQAGRTPHPCIACNERIKFDFLYRRANMLGAQYVATGHYARIRRDGSSYQLLKGMDPFKDQSYVLYSMGQRELERTLMPVGWHPKEEIRRLASDAGLPNANKPDSQDICFIPGGDYREFLKRHLTPREGSILNESGQVLGKHEGIENFTVGQRRGLGVAGKAPMYVISIDAAAGRVVVGPEEHLYRDALWASGVSYVSGSLPESGEEVTAKIRYKSPECSASLRPSGNWAEIRFCKPQRAVTPGQAVALYQGEVVLGGGRIEAGPPAGTAQSSSIPVRSAAGS